MSVSAQSLARHLSDLVGRQVQLQPIEMPVFSPSVMFACYDVEPYGETTIVKIDYELLAALAGTLLGFPANLVLPMVRNRTLNDDMSDAAREIMNVLAGAISDDGRAVFQGLFEKAGGYSRNAELIVQRHALCSLSVKASLPGYGPGYLSIY